MCPVVLTNRMTRCSDSCVNTANAPFRHFSCSTSMTTYKRDKQGYTCSAASLLNLCHYDWLIWHGDCHDGQKHPVVWSRPYSYSIFSCKLLSGFDLKTSWTINKFPFYNFVCLSGCSWLQRWTKCPWHVVHLRCWYNEIKIQWWLIFRQMLVSVS